MLLGQHLIICQGRDDRDKITRQCLPMHTFGFAFVVALESAGLFNRLPSILHGSKRLQAATTCFLHCIDRCGIGH